MDRPSLSRSQRGMSRFEFGVVAVVFGVLVAVLLQRLGDFQELAERADMEYAARMFKSALRIRVSVLMVEGRMQETARLVCENPVRWLDRRPARYFGEAHDAASVARVPPGYWYFDPVECTTGYMVRGGHFAPDSQGLKRVRYRVRAVAEDVAGHPAGLVFEPMEPYRWQIQ